MKHLSKAITVFLTSFFFITCFAASAPSSKSPSPDLAEKKVITIDANHPEFTIQLQSNPTTGYSWFVKKMDKKLLKVKSHQYVRPTLQMPGAGGYEEWHFVAKPAAFNGPKTTMIRMVYVRPWEKTPVKEILYTVEIK